ncbi:hemolysin secretion protein D [Thioclava dalianensis]|uniref:Hemolysin secretion protein D n=1 Tax=Thioclava dalianensis TaxID=1185766 RepID=A0A074TIE1_9RHOB|nr:HlyD family secretion protein [Thioclava dalianensis]KEP71414.1 hemolysin secretion protein D [Thioclava dalianensis]SFM79485.1 Multidrug resistance efflux pump [Thioclava dalianensis]
MSLSKRHINTGIVVLMGVLGLLVVLYAWRLPPFTSQVAWTDNAYLHGRVTTLSSQVSSLVTEVPVKDFDTVSKGEVLVKLDDRSLVAALAQAKAQLEAARAAQANGEQAVASAKATLDARNAALASAQASARTAQTTMDRATKLNAKNYMSQSDTDQAQLALDQANANLREAKSAIEVATQAVKTAELNRHSLDANVDAAQAALDSAKVQLDHAVIRAPEAGTLGQVGVRVGQFVSAGSSLMGLVPHDLWLIANYKETELKGMTVGDAVQFSVDALGGETFTGRIERFSPATAAQFSLLSSSNATGNFTKVAQRVPVRISIDPGQPDLDKLVPGLSVEVRVNKARVVPVSTDAGPSKSKGASAGGA